VVRPAPSRSSLIILGLLLISFVGWSVLVFTWPPLLALDSQAVAPRLPPGSAGVEIASALALLTWPGVQYAALAAIAYWAYRRRLRNLALALVTTIVLGWAGTILLSLIFARPRPETRLELLTALGYAYPSGHLAATVACCVCVGAVFAVTRRSARRKLAWQIGASALVLVVALDRWLLGAHFPSDLVGGALWGALAAVASLIICGVHVPVTHEIVQEFVRDLLPRAEPHEHTGRRCAVIFNPIKITDWRTFRRRIEYELSSRGWQPALWLETSPTDPGRAMTQQALAEDVDLVLGVGGDGTIRIICAGLAGTGVPLGLIPAGTGNLLARNLGVPLDESLALTAAFDGVERAIDLIGIRVDHQAHDYFAVMAGIGVDAVIMQGANPDLKKAVGSAAYFVSAAQYANRPPVHVTVAVDEHPPLRRRAHVVLIGNVGLLSGNIPLIPDARADDGVLDVLIASPRSFRDWVLLILRVLTRRRRTDEQLTRLQGQRVTLTVEEPDHYQLDGDTVGSCTTMIAEVHPSALLLRVPTAPASVEPRPALASAEHPGGTRRADSVDTEASRTSSVDVGRSLGRS
jgi:diacylglycerol kinase (ATP)